MKNYTSFESQQIITSHLEDDNSWKSTIKVIQRRKAEGFDWEDRTLEVLAYDTDLGRSIVVCHQSIKNTLAACNGNLFDYVDNENA